MPIQNNAFLCFFAFSLLVQIPPITQKNNDPPKVSRYFGALEGIRTPDLLIRSQTLYPAELPAHFFLNA